MNIPEKILVPAYEVSLDTAGLPALQALYNASLATRPGLEDIKSLKSLFDAVVQSRECISLLNRELEDVGKNLKDTRGVMRDKSYVIFRSHAHSLTMMHRDTSSFSRESDASSSAISSLGSDCLVAVQNGSDKVDLGIYKFPSDARIDVFDPNVVLIGPMRATLCNGGESIAIYSSNVCTVDQKSPTTFLRLDETRCVPYSWAFDASSLKPKIISATLPSVARLQVVLELIDIQYGNNTFGPSDLDALEKLTTNAYHFVRWKAIQLLFSIDRDKGVKLMRRALSDPHPHVNQAAKSSLIRICGEDELSANLAT